MSNFREFDRETSFLLPPSLVREMGMLKLGTVALDGTKIPANASRHSALSYKHAGKIEAQLKAVVADLMARAEAAGQAEISDGMSIPEELARREERLAKLAGARAKLEARAKERFEQGDGLALHQASRRGRFQTILRACTGWPRKPSRSAAEGEAAVNERHVERAEQAKLSPGFCEAAPYPDCFFSSATQPVRPALSCTR